MKAKNISEIYLKQLLCLSLILLPLPVSTQVIPVSPKSNGMPAYPFLTEVTQADGSKISLAGRGNRMIHWYVTGDNYSVLKDKAGNYVYAVLNEEGDMVPSSMKVTGDPDDRPAGLEKNAGFSKKQVELFNKEYFNDAAVKANPNPFPAVGTNKVLVLLVEYPDKPHTYEPASIENLMNMPEFNSIGSFRDYYLDMSYNQLELNATVSNWVQASNNMSYYGANDEYGYDLRPQELVREAVDLAEAAGVDFSQFDNDGDGYIDDLIVFHSGFGEQYTDSGDTCIWSHAYHLGDLSVEYDGVRIDNYLLCPELYGSTGSDLTSIGTVVHEFAHSLALPDLNDEDYEESGGFAFDLNFWDMMAVGSWNNEGNTPAGINAWLKSYIGWMTIPEIADTGSFSLQSAISHQEAYQINTPVYNEFFILENRQWEGFDDYLPGHGMLIYHVDLNYPGWISGYVNADPAHQGFDLEEADDIRDTISLPADPFPGTDGITAFDASTIPSSNTWNGQNSNVSIQNISETDGVIGFDVKGTNYDQLPAEWSIEPLTYSNIGKITARVVIGTDTIESGYLSAFYNGECRGIAPATYHSETADYLFELPVYSDAATGEELVFYYYDPVADSIYNLYETLNFTSGMETGSITDPYIIHAPVQYSRTFTSGWNWFSLNTELSDMTPGNILPTCASGGDYIKNQTKSTTYYAGYGWFGTISSLNSTDLFFIKISSSCGIDFKGLPVEPASKTLSLVTGWNWISYLPAVSMAPDVALSSMSAANLDYIKNQTKSITYYAGYGWFGTLNQMNPGEGYMMKLSHSDALTYPADIPAGKAARQTTEKEWISDRFSPGNYEFNGSLTARVSIDGESVGTEGDVLYAWSGNECRGASAGLYFDPGMEVLFPIMVFSNVIEGEELRFTYYDKAAAKEYLCNGTVTFEKDMVLADAINPLNLEVLQEVSGIPNPESGTSLLSAWPNPFGENLYIRYQLSEPSNIKLELFDIFGKRIAVLSDGYFEPGEYSLEWKLSGKSSDTYILKLNDGKTVYTQRIIHID